MIAKVLIGILSILPFAYTLFFAGTIVRAIATASEPPEGLFRTIAVLHVAVIFLLLGLLVYYIAHVFRNGSLSGEQKAMWAVLLVIANVITMPMYWYFYVLGQNDGGEIRP